MRHRRMRHGRMLGRSVLGGRERGRRQGMMRGLHVGVMRPRILNRLRVELHRRGAGAHHRERVGRGAAGRLLVTPGRGGGALSARGPQRHLEVVPSVAVITGAQRLHEHLEQLAATEQRVERRLAVPPEPEATKPRHLLVGGGVERCEQLAVEAALTTLAALVLGVAGVARLWRRRGRALVPMSAGRLGVHRGGLVDPGVVVLAPLGVHQRSRLAPSARHLAARPLRAGLGPAALTPIVVRHQASGSLPQSRARISGGFRFGPRERQGPSRWCPTDGQLGVA